MYVNKKNLTLGVIAIFILATPILKYYNFPGTTVSMESLMLLVSVTLMFWVNNKYSRLLSIRDIYDLNPYFIVLVCILISTFVFDFIINNDSSRFYVVIFLAISTLELYNMQRLTINNWEFFDIFKNLYIKICIIFSIITILEEIFYITSGLLVPIKLSCFPLTDEMAPLEYRFGYNGRGGYVGFSPFFSEPAHMAQYMIPALVLLLSSENEKHDEKNVLKMILIEAAIVLSTSTFGILASGIMVVFYLMLGKSIAARRIRKIFLLCLPVIMVVYFYFIRGRLFYDSAGASSLISADKAGYRIFRGIAYYVQFPFINQLFGIGFNNIASFINNHSLHYVNDVIADNVVVEYLNGFSQAIIYGGIVSFLLFCDFVVRLYRKGSSESKTLVIGFVLLMLNAATFLRGTSVFYILVILMLKAQYLKKSNEEHILNL